MVFPFCSKVHCIQYYKYQNRLFAYDKHMRSAGWIHLLPAAWLVCAAGAERGPALHTAMPDFTLPDQNGRTWTLPELLGPNGAMLVFYRSADW